MILDRYKIKLYTYFLAIIVFFACQSLLAQEFRSKSRRKSNTMDSLQVPEGPVNARIIYGKVFEKSTGLELPLASIVEEGTSNGVMSSIDGTFFIKIDLTKPVTLTCSYLGFATERISLDQNSSHIYFSLEQKYQVKKDVVISASRKIERKFESPVTIDMLNVSDLRYNPTMNMYDRIVNMAGIDVITTSVGFKALNARGFNSTYNHRFLQRLDNMDLSMPGFNFSVGMLNGPIDIDVERVEIIPGPSSALYGPNIINGLINSTSKNPFDFKGLTVNYKTGVNHIDGIDAKPSPSNDFSLRYANTFGREKWAYKIALGYTNATDWKASDYNDIANYSYSKNLTAYGYEKGKGNPGYEASNILGDEVTNVFDSNTTKFQTIGGTIKLLENPLKIARTGYREDQLLNYKPYNIKSDFGIQFRPTKHTEVSWTSRISAGSSNFQIDNRVMINDFLLTQNKLEIKSNNWVFRSYLTTENTGQTVDQSLAAMNINRSAKEDGNWFVQYLLAYSGYFNTLNNFYALGYDSIQKGSDAAARKFADGNTNDLALKAKNAGLDTNLVKLLYGRAQYQPGSKEFDSAYNYVTNHSPTENGASLKSTSKAFSSEFVYDFKNRFKWATVLAGLNYKLNAPATLGTVFNDKANAIYSNEFGGFAQLSKSFKDDRIKFQVSGRMDYMQRFDPTFSPRTSVVFLLGEKKQHSLRFSTQIGYRFPALIDQFSNVPAVGATTLGGFYGDALALNLVRRMADGTDQVNMYIQNSVNTYFATGDSNLLVKPIVKNIEPEKLTAFEMGYRTFLFDELETDLNFYYSYYQNLIITQQYIGALNQKDEINAQYIKDPQKTLIYRMAVNSRVPATAYGVSFALNYYFAKNLILLGNYNFNQMVQNSDFLKQDFIAAFNTPKNKFNIGINGIKIKKYFGFSSNLRWIDQIEFKEYNKEGIVGSYYNLDLMISYTMPKQKTMFKIGGSNVTNQRYTQSLGAPTIGAMFYFSILFDELIK